MGRGGLGTAPPAAPTGGVVCETAGRKRSPHPGFADLPVVPLPEERGRRRGAGRSAHDHLTFTLAARPTAPPGPCPTAGRPTGAGAGRRLRAGRGLLGNPDAMRPRRSVRLPDYDCARPGAYFVTVCTDRRACVFGEVVGGAVRLSAAGQVVQEEWERSATVRAEVALDAFVTMPNHVHGLVLPTDRESPCKGDRRSPVPRRPPRPPGRAGWAGRPARARARCRRRTRRRSSRWSSWRRRRGRRSRGTPRSRR